MRRVRPLYLGIFGMLIALILIVTSCGGGGRGFVLSRPAMKSETMLGEPAEDDSGMQYQRESAGGAEGFDTEEYGKIDENPFLSALHNPLSTFSIDVDTASYANIRRFLTRGDLPYKDAVRIEEMINYFTYSYPTPEDGEPFTVNTWVASCPWNSSHELAIIGIQGEEIPEAELPPANIVFLIDVSGSMDAPEKLPLLKSAFRLLVEQLREEDRVAIVVYAGAAGLVLDSTPGNEKKAILAAIDDLQAGGSTAGGAGLKLAYAVARDHFVQGGNNRIILATDGDFNVGPSSDGAMVRLIEENRDRGVFMTVLGFGMGNLKDSKMEKIADRGNGNYAYIDSRLEAKKVLVSEFGGTMLTIAKDVKIQVEFNPAMVKGYRLIGYENRMLAKEDFADDRKDAGELGSGHSVTAVYEIIPADSDEPLPGVDDLRYQSKKVRDEAYETDEIMTVKLRYKEPDGEKSTLLTAAVKDGDAAYTDMGDDFRFVCAVTAFGMVLRDSAYRGDADYRMALALARGAVGSDAEGYRREFIRLVELAMGL
jgi:Ca-activated chloride channel family protein